MLKPTTSIEYLGFIIDSDAMTVTMPTAKTEGIAELLQSVVRKSVLKIRAVAQLVGALIATAPVNPHALLFTKMLEKENKLSFKNKSGQL